MFLCEGSQGETVSLLFPASTGNQDASPRGFLLSSSKPAMLTLSGLSSMVTSPNLMLTSAGKVSFKDSCD